MPIGDLSHYVRIYDGSMDAALCGRMIDSFNNLRRFQKANGRGFRAGLEKSAWTELNVTRCSDAEFVSMFRYFIDQALVRYNSDLGLPISIPNTAVISDLVMKRYRPGNAEQFQLHFDAVNHLANRYLVIMWYLNDVHGGGETSFPQIGLKVSPRVGRLLMFPPYWMYQHEGMAPHSGDKYILSTYLLFPMPQAA